MSRRIVTVLKSAQVLVSGSVRLEPGDVAAPVRTTASAQTDAHPQQARIIESNDEYAVIEVICGCGGKSHIQCNYAPLTQNQQDSPTTDEKETDRK